MSAGVIFCPACKETNNFEMDFAALVPGFPEDVTIVCRRCGATLESAVKMDVVVGKARMIAGPADKKWLTLQAYYQGRRLEDMAEPWFMTSCLPVHFIMRNEVCAHTIFHGREYVTDGYVALRVHDGTSFHCVNKNSETFSKFLLRVSEDPGSPARLVARIVGADLRGDLVDDYAALKCDAGRIIFLIAAHVEAILGDAPSAQFFIEKNGDFAVVMVDGCLYATIARLVVDDARYDQVAGFGGAA